VFLVKMILRIGCLVVLGGVASAQQPADAAISISVNWSAGRTVLKTTPTLQVVVNPCCGAVVDSRRSVFKFEAAGRGLCAVCAMASVFAAGSGGVGTT
jgi:hypothetical protein